MASKKRKTLAEIAEEYVKQCKEEFGLKEGYLHMVGTRSLLRVDEVLVDGIKCGDVCYAWVPFAPINKNMADKIIADGTYSNIVTVNTVGTVN